jgi:hypothetical protein
MWGPKVRNTYRLPKRLPEGTKYVVESAGRSPFRRIAKRAQDSVVDPQGAAVRLRRTDQYCA